MSHNQIENTTPPVLYIIAGCNGAGKTTASMSVLPEVLSCREFVNADEIAKGLSPLNPESVAIQAGKLMLDRIDLLLKQRSTFAIETTLATRSYAKLVEKAKEMHYMVYLLYFWLPTPEMAVRRVAQRVMSGGHNIPTDTIYRRYYAGLDNLFNIFVEKVDCWSLYENSESMKVVVKRNMVIDSQKLLQIQESCQKRKK